MGDNAQRSGSNASKVNAAVQYAHQAEKLSYIPPEHDASGAGTAIQADFVTPQDPIIITGDGGRLPGVPLAEATKLNDLKAEIEGEPGHVIKEEAPTKLSPEQKESSGQETPPKQGTIQRSQEGSLRKSMPPSQTHPLFPPLPLYGPSSITRDLQCIVFRTSSFFLSLGFLGVIVLGSAFTSIPLMLRLSSL